MRVPGPGGEGEPGLQTSDWGNRAEKGRKPKESKFSEGARCTEGHQCCADIRPQLLCWEQISEMQENHKSRERPTCKDQREQCTSLTQGQAQCLLVRARGNDLTIHRHLLRTKKGLASAVGKITPNSIPVSTNNA